MTNNTSLPPATADHETAPRTDSPYLKALLITLQNAIEGRVTLDRFQIATAYECISGPAAANARADAERKAREEREEREDAEIWRIYEAELQRQIDSARGEGEVCAPTMHPTAATPEHG